MIFSLVLQDVSHYETQGIIGLLKSLQDLSHYKMPVIIRFINRNRQVITIFRPYQDAGLFVK